jgi:hypothetical protein
MTKHAFAALDGTLRPGVWMHRPLPTYDPSTGSVVAPPVVLYDVPVLVSEYRREEIDGTRILATDRRLCVRQAALPVAPHVRDRIDVGGTVWQLVTVAQDAAGLTWQCQGRAEGEQP